MTRNWLFSKRWLLIKFVALIVLAIAFHVHIYRELEVHRDMLAEQGFDSSRLEGTSRFEKEFRLIFDAAEAYVDGSPGTTAKDVKFALDVFWSRTGSADGLLRLSYGQNYDHADFMKSMTAALPRLEAAVNELRPGMPRSMETLNALEAEFGPGVSAFSDAGYRARIKKLQEISLAEWRLFEALKQYQMAFSIYGVGLLLLLLGELFWSNRIVNQLQRSGDANKLLGETDQLTGLYNRRFLDLELTQRLADPRRGALTTIAVDIDRFRSANDSFGHAVVDKLLVETTKRMKFAADTNSIGRMAGDEFLILLDHPLKEARRLSERLRKAAAEPIDIADRLYQTSITCTIAEHRPGDSPEEVFHRINATMQEAKALGGGGVVEFRPEFMKNLKEKAVIEAYLGEAIKADAIEIVAQPKLNLIARDVFGYEALARWNHPTLGWISPEKFCAIADSIGLSSPLGVKVADLAFGLTAALKQSGHGGRMSINVSPAFGSHPTFVGDISRLLAKHRLAPEDIELEVTEEAMLSDGGSVSDNMSAMRELGIHVAIDDFGKGHPNISRLTKLDVSVIKADRSLVDQLTTDRSARAIIGSLVQLSRELDIELVVEGVETEAQATILAELGVKKAQGYLFSRPLSHLSLLTWLETHRSEQDSVRALQSIA